jgi:hypothetical protein
MKTDMIEFETKRTTQELGRILADAVVAARGETAPYESPSGALQIYDDEKAIAVVARGQSSALSLSGFWAVQIFVFEQEGERLARLVALGDGGFTRAMSGSKNTVSLGLGVKKRDGFARQMR